MIWQVVRFLKPETICRVGGRTQLEEGRGKEKDKIFGKLNCKDRVPVQLFYQVGWD